MSAPKPIATFKEPSPRAGASTSGLVRRMIGANSTDRDAFYWGRSRAALAGKARGGEGRQAGRRLP